MTAVVVATARPDYRPALDGLRALAVGLVLAYHFGATWMPGGFLGVDAFFVLSGYLITRLLLREHAATGGISLGRFWARRVRRLVPALVLVLLAVSVWALAFGEPEEQYDSRRDGLAALFNVANWWFIASDKSYFEEFAGVSALRHTWSLSIEEQFYLAWPLLLLVLLRIRRGRLAGVALVTMALALGSAAAMAGLSGADPSRAYYGTDARVHELLVGVLLALAVHGGLVRGATLAARRRWSVVAGLALATVMALAATMDDGATFYYRGGAVVFSLAVAALIVGLEFGAGPARRLLEARPVVAVGVISYGVYLWHWPIGQWVHPVSTGITHPAALAAVKVALVLAASTVSYWLVERPVRRGRVFRLRLTGRRTAVALPLTLGLTTGLIFAATPSSAVPSWAAVVRAGTFKVMGDQVGAGAPTVAIIGDSIAKSMLPGLDAAAKAAGVRLVAGSWSGCGVGSGFQLDLDGRTVFDFSDDCDRAVPGAYRQLVEQYRPDVVWWHSVRERFPRRTPDGGVLAYRTPEHDAAVLADYQDAFQILHSRGAPVLVSTVVLRAQRFKGTCKQAPDQLHCAPDPGTDGEYAHLNQLSRRFVAAASGARVFDLAPFVCPGDAPCPTYVDHVMLRYDGSHLTAGGTHVIGPPVLRAILDAAKIRPLRPSALPAHMPAETASARPPQAPAVQR